MAQGTLGQQRVRKLFNPSNNQTVDTIKEIAAELIDFCHTANVNAKDAEQKRLWALAMTSVEDGAMWAVKAATYE